MAKYHINMAGEPGVCNARKKCPYGDFETDHFRSPQEARRSYELENEVHNMTVDEKLRELILNIAERQLPNASRVVLRNALYDGRMSEHELNIGVVALSEEWDKYAPSLVNKRPFEFEKDDLDSLHVIEQIARPLRLLTERSIRMKEARLKQLEEEFGPRHD